MRRRLEDVLNDFKSIPCLAEAPRWDLVRVEFCDAPHAQPRRKLRNGQHAIYLFFRGQEWLRVGKTSQNARFVSHHYGINRAGSTLAKDVCKNRSELGFDGGDEDVGDWIKGSCGRANVLLAVGWPESVSLLLESYLHYRLTPRFEGRRPRSRLQS